MPERVAARGLVYTHRTKVQYTAVGSAGNSSRMFRFCVAALALFACISLARTAELLTEPPGRIIITVRDQKLMFVHSCVKPITYRVSTSQFSPAADLQP